MTGTVVCESVRKDVAHPKKPAWYFDLVAESGFEMAQSGISILSDNPEEFIVGRKYELTLTEKK